MKIGILTHHYINNFGAFLQAYCLQQAISELYPNDDVYIIDCLNLKHFIINTGGWFRFYNEKENLSCWISKINIPHTFSKVRKQHMNLTKRCYTAKDIEKLGLDYVVVGSDEVWNYKEDKGNTEVKFGIGLNKEKLVAYAPSVGKSTDLDVPKYVSDGIRKFKAVSARDVATEKIAGKIRNEEVCRVVDPTFLYKIDGEPVKGIKKPYVLFYYCDGLAREEKKKIIAYAKQNGMEVYGAGECDKLYSDITADLTPFQWVWMFKNASYVVTGTFHGAVFSMLNHRKFACYLTNPSRIKKVSSLLNEFNLSDRQAAGNADEIIKTMTKEIDYESIEQIFNKRRAESKEYLKRAID